jgi:hypothetical protein
VVLVGKWEKVAQEPTKHDTDDNIDESVSCRYSNNVGNKQSCRTHRN